MEKKLYPSVFVLVCINVMDSLMASVVGPTLIFYVRSLGGTKEDFGKMISLASLSSMIMMPVYGKWVDSNGSKYHPPYMACFLLGMLGALLYFGAILLPLGRIAIYTMMFSFLCSGGADAGRTLAYSWVASSIPIEEQRSVLTFLSMSRTFGSIAGPVLNILVSEVNMEFTFFGTTVPVTPYNSIGLLMFAGEATIALGTMLFLMEPPEPKSKPKENRRSSVVSIASIGESKGMLYALSHFDVFFPIYTMFTMACCFTLLFTGLSPVASNIGYTPVQISEIMALNAAVIAFAMVISMVISVKKGVPDAAMIGSGLTGLMIGSSSMYFFWKTGVTHLEFTLPVFVLSAGYPFIGPANRSKYTRAIHGRKELEGCQGVMLAIINQAFALASFISPTIIASFFIRSPDSMATGSYDHYLTPGALVVPGLTLMGLAGVLYGYLFHEPPDVTNTEKDVVSESSALVEREKKSPRASMLQINDRFSRHSETQRRLSVEAMGIPNPFETKYEEEISEQLLKDKNEWEELERLDRIEDENEQNTAD